VNLKIVNPIFDQVNPKKQLEVEGFISFLERDAFSRDCEFGFELILFSLELAILLIQSEKFHAVNKKSLTRRYYLHICAYIHLRKNL
jgi:hypothetical protein